MNYDSKSTYFGKRAVVMNYYSKLTSCDKLSKQTLLHVFI